MIEKWIWIVVLVIAVAAVIKIITMIYQKHRANGGSQNNPQNHRNISTVNINTNSPLPADRTTETGSMIYYANDRHGRADKEYRFNYKKVNGSWRAYILRTPSLGSRNSAGYITHRNFDNGRPYICWDSPVNSLKDMQNISRVWADNIQEYIATGKRFG